MLNTTVKREVTDVKYKSKKKKVIYKYDSTSTYKTIFLLYTRENTVNNNNNINLRTLRVAC